MSEIIDCELTRDEALIQNPESICPQHILEEQILLPVRYLGFDGLIHKGQLVVDAHLRKDIETIFEELTRRKFPLASVIPAAHPRFGWNDSLMMKMNNTSSFNYRTIARTATISLHAFGQAIDINPALNPYTRSDGSVEPEGAVYDPGRPGTITEGSFILKLFDNLGWEWGGRWKQPDYQHFEKSLH